MLVQFGGNWITQNTDVILGYWALSAARAGVAAAVLSLGYWWSGGSCRRTLLCVIGLPTPFAAELSLLHYSSKVNHWIL